MSWISCFYRCLMPQLIYEVCSANSLFWKKLECTFESIWAFIRRPNKYIWTNLMFLWTSVQMSFIFELILDILHFQESCTWIGQGQPKCTWSHLIEIYGHDIIEHVPTCQTKLNWFVASMDVSLHKRIFFILQLFLKILQDLWQ